MNPSDDENFEERWQELASQLSGEIETSDLPELPETPDTPEASSWSKPSQRTGRSGPRDWDSVDGDPHDEHFIPPEPPAMASPHPVRNLAWTGASVGLLTLLITVILRGPLASVIGDQAVRWCLIGGLVVLVASIGLLLFLMPHTREDDDTGAQV